MIHRFNELGMRSLDPQWAGGRPRRISPEDEAFIIATATTRPETLEQPFTRTITVPFPPEAKASGIGKRDYHPIVWYRRTFRVATPQRLSSR